MEVTIRKNEKEIKIGERTFLVKKFDPMTGNYILMKIMTMVLPFGMGGALSGALGDANALSSATGKMSKVEFMELQTEILQCCFEVLPGNTTPVLHANGSYGVVDFDMTTCLQVLIGALVFNFEGFFSEKGFSLDNIMSSMSPATTKM